MLLAACVVFKSVEAVVTGQLHSGHDLLETTITTINRIKLNKISPAMTAFHKKGKLENPPNRTGNRK